MGEISGGKGRGVDWDGESGTYAVDGRVAFVGCEDQDGGGEEEGSGEAEDRHGDATAWLVFSCFGW